MSERASAASALRADGTLTDRLAHAISIVCAPPILALPLALLAGRRSPDDPSPWPAVALFTIATALLPSLLVYVAYRKGYVRSLDLTSRAERIVPSAFTALCAVAVYPLLRELDAPKVVLGVAAALAVQLTVLAVVTSWWKVSYHAATAAGLAAIASTWNSVSLGLMLVALAGLVGWARIRLGRHTRAQVAVGLVSAAPMVWWTWS